MSQYIYLSIYIGKKIDTTTGAAQPFGQLKSMHRAPLHFFVIENLLRALSYECITQHITKYKHNISKALHYI